MIVQTPSYVIAFAVIVLQVLGPATLWALDEQRDVRVEGTRRAVVSGLTGGELTTTSGGRSKLVQFGEEIKFGDKVSTGSGTVVEILVNGQALVTILGEAQVRLEQEGGNTVVHLTQGDVLVSVAASRLPQGQEVVIATPATRAHSTGGVIRAHVGSNAPQARLDGHISDAHPHLVLFSPTTQVVAALFGIESFAAVEGSVQVEANTPDATSVTVPAGQGIESASGKLGTPSVLASSIRNPVPVIAIPQHDRTPSSGVELVTKQQMEQVEALQQALFGGGEVEAEEGQTNSAQGAIISTLFGTSETGGSNPNNLFFGSGSPYAAALLNALNALGTGVADDLNDLQQVNIYKGTFGTNVRGGSGQLLFTNFTNRPLSKTDFSTAIELLRVDGGALDSASHLGIAPRDTLIVRGVNSNTNFDLTFRTGNPGPATRESIELNGPVGVTGEVQTITVPTIGGGARFYQTALGAPPDSTTLAGLSLFSNQRDGAFGFTDLVSGPGTQPLKSLIEGAITARSATSGTRLVTLSGGVVLDQGTQVGLGTTTSTNNYVQFKPGLSADDRNFTGALLSVLASQEGGFNPAFLKINDRALAVMDGSQVNGSGNVALLAVLDSRLIGPTTTVVGQQGGQIPALLEIDSLSTLPQSKVTNVKSAVVVRYTNVSFGALDGALLEASSPILAINYGSMTTSGHFADLSTNGKVALNANLPAGALVQLNNGSLTVGGNLFNLNNAKANVTGALFSLGANSTLTINGVLISLRSNSLFRLTSPTLGVFGQNSRLTLNNSLCSTSCKTLTVGSGSLRVAGGGTVELPTSGFSAFLSVDGKAVNSPASSNGIERVVLSQGTNTAHFFVETGSTLKIVAPK